MSEQQSKTLTKKTSKHPRESNSKEFYEEVVLREEQNANKHTDIFSMPNIFLNEPKTHVIPKKQSIESTKETIAPQKQINSIKETKRIIDRKRKKYNRPRLQQKDLSLIQQSQGEYNNTSSSNDSILNESSIENIETSSLSYSEKSFDDDDKMNEGFIDEQSEDDVLNKTVVMSKKKASREHESPKNQQELAENQLEQLYLFAKKNSVNTLYKLYQEGRLSEMKFLLILEIKKEDEKIRKEDKFHQNLTEIQNDANVIDENYHLLHQKLSKDTNNDNKKLKTFTQNIIKIYNEKTLKAINLPNPLASKLQLQTLQVMAELKAKQNFLTILQEMRQTFQSQYNKCIQKIKVQKNTRPNFSENLIFTEMKQLIKTNKQIYLFFERSLINDNRSERSLISLHARKHYLDLLSEKFQEQMVRIEEFKAKSLKNEAIKLLQNQKATQISEDLSVKLLKSIQKRVSEQLHKTKQQFLQHIVWLRIIRQKGELDEGKIFRQAVWVMSNNKPLNIPIFELRQKYLIQNYKFYRRNVSKKISAQFETIKQLFQSSNNKRQALREQIEKRKKQDVENCLNNLERKVEYLEIHAQKDDILNVFMRGNSLKLKEINKSEDYFQILQRRIKKMKDLQQKTDQLLLVSDKNLQKKLLIPPKRVVKQDFRAKQTDVLTGHCSTQKKNTLMDRLESRYRVEHSTDDIKVQIEKDRLPLEKHCLNFKNQMLEIEKQRNFICAQQESEKEYTELQRRRYFDRVYELISNKQILGPSSEEQKEQQEAYCPPTQSEMQWSYMSKIRFANQRSKTKKDHSHYYHSPSRKQILSSPHMDVSSHSYQSPDLKSNLSAYEIQEACKIFTREFYFNPNFSSQLQLNEEQFYFLMSPDYRRNCLEKKLKDQYLEERIINIIKSNPLPMNQVQQQHSSPYNPINYMIQTDPQFQQRIQQYQDKIVKSRHLSLHSDHNSQYQNDSWICGQKDRSYSLFDQCENQMLEIQTKRSLHYWTENKSDFDTVASQRESSEMWLCN